MHTITIDYGRSVKEVTDAEYDMIYSVPCSRWERHWTFAMQESMEIRCFGYRWRRDSTADVERKVICNRQALTNAYNELVACQSART